MATIIADGDHVAYLIRLKVTHMGPYVGVLATGKHIEHDATGIDRLQRGKIGEHHANPDALGILGQLGALKS